MPTYEYRCTRCGRESEESRSFDDRRRVDACNALTHEGGRCLGTMELQVSVPSKAVVQGGTGAARSAR